MNNATTVLECIDCLGEIFDFDFSGEDKKTVCFKQTGKNGKGTDRKYFKYLRSLCSIHPIKTSLHKEFQDIYTEIECSPYVRWNDGITFAEKEYDLVAIVYTNNPQNPLKYIGIKLKEIFAYIEYRFNLISKLIDHIDTFFGEIIDKYRQTPLKAVNYFSNYCEYIEYIKSVYSDRINSGHNELFDFYSCVFKCNFSNKENQEKLQKYQNSIKLGFSFLHRYLQELPEEDTYETTGLHNHSDNIIGESLFFKLQEAPVIDDKYSYCIEKLSLLWLPPHKIIAKPLIDNSKPFWGKYVLLEPNMTAIEISVLVHVLWHFYKIENDKNYNFDIPNTEDYR